MSLLRKCSLFSLFSVAAAIFLFIFLGPSPTQIIFISPSPNLYPVGITWDPSAQHFIVGSLRHRTLVSVSIDGVAQTLISDPHLPENVTFFGLTIDSVNNRLLAAVHALSPLPQFDALASYDIRTRRRVFLSHLPSGGEARPFASSVAVDLKGNAYVTNSAGNFIWKVNERGEASIFSKSPVFTAHPADHSSPFSVWGLNGIVYSSEGYLLVVQSNTGKMFKVKEEDGTASLVLLNEDLSLAMG